MKTVAAYMTAWTLKWVETFQEEGKFDELKWVEEHETHGNTASISVFSLF